MQIQCITTAVVMQGEIPAYAHCGGQSREIVLYCIDWCLQQGLPLRADTHADNIYMQRALTAAGFVRCGTIYTEDGTPRLAYYHRRAD